MKPPFEEPGLAAPPQIDLIYGGAPAPQTEAAHSALQQAVNEALDRKRRLGQYAVFWQNGQAVQVAPEALPAAD